MKEFLRQVAECFYSELGDGIGDCCFVFPNRRSALFFQKYLGQTAGRPVFAPHLLTINDLFAQLSGLRQADKIEMLYMLYQRYASLMWPDGEVKESFDEFVYWGDTLLNDFDDIDKYRVDAKQLFTNIRDLNDIDAGYEYLSDEQIAAIRQFWGDFLHKPAKDNGEEGFDKKAYFARTWSIIYPLYTAFRADLQAKGLAYEGMIYRGVADMVLTGSIPASGRIVFVGLNALNECEKVLLDALRKEGVADFYWDFSGHMVTDRDNKSAMFMTENIRRYPSRHDITACLPASQNFRSIAVPTGVGQTRVVSGLIEDIFAEQGFVAEETAVVLPDENLLMPMLGAVPQCVEDINVTMGFPLESSNVATFISMIERLHKNKRVKGGSCAFYHRDVVALLDHPFVRSCFAASDDDTVRSLSRTITSGIRARNIIFSNAVDLAARHPLLAAIFKDIQAVEDFPAYLEDIFDIVQKYVSPVDREFIFQMETCIRSLQNLRIEMLQSTYFKLLMQLASVLQIHFSGEPLSGLQIMGPLETRALDFKNVIVLSVNEGTFPKRSVSASFIPYNLRLGFGLPNYEFQDAISAYHFYRSICRAENVILLHDSRTDGLPNGEESRYIKQLKYHFEQPLSEETASYILSSSSSAGSGAVEKTPDVMEKIKELFAGKGRFSATSLNEYLDCRLKFYYARILGISEADEVSEGLDAGMFGSVFHKVMEDIYSPMKDHEVSAEDIDAVREDAAMIDRLIDEAFASECQIYEISGRNIIVKNLIRRFVGRVLEVDRGRAPFRMEGAELGKSFKLDVPGCDFPVTVYGKIDRLDSFDGLYHIIDYKTGTVNKKADFKQVDELFDRDSAHRPTIAFQLCLYALLMLEGDASANAGNLIPTVYALREIFDGQPVERLVLKEETEKFRELLVKLISEVFDPQVPFSPAEEGSDTCKYCDFRKMCNR